jgi:hypothetical protein
MTFTGCETERDQVVYEAGHGDGLVSGYWQGYADAIAEVLKRYPECFRPTVLKMLGPEAQKAMVDYDWR